MTKKKAAKVPKPRKPETVDDKFNELGVRERTVRMEEILCHYVNESTDSEGERIFEAECRINIYLEDGRMLGKVFGLDFDISDID